MTLEERVDAGIALLDEMLPSWEKNVDVEQLSIESCLRCVLGRVYGSFGEGMEAVIGHLGEEPDHRGRQQQETRLAIEYGFDGNPDGGYIEQTKALTELWKAAIRARVSPPGPRAA